jgi:hypothetical protein
MTLHQLVIIYFVLTMISAVLGTISWRVFAPVVASIVGAGLILLGYAAVYHWLIPH